MLLSEGRYLSPFKRVKATTVAYALAGRAL